MSSFKALESEVVQRVTGFREDCTFTRHGAVDCIARYIDTNHDDIVTVAEIDAARNRYMGFVLRILQKAVSWEIDISTEKIVQDCGGSNKGEFTEENFLHGPASKTCMADQVSMCMFEAVCKHVANVYEEEKRASRAPRKSTWWNRIKNRL
jgi:hypothetical protein